MNATPSVFHPAELVVYPAQGVGTIERIDSQQVGGMTCDFFIVRIIASNVTLMVPLHSAGRVGLRHLVSPEEAEEVLTFLRTAAAKNICTGQNWNRRFREYSDKLQSPDLHQVASVLKELLSIGQVKELSFGEKRLQEQAMGLVCGELAQVLQMEEATIREQIIAAHTPESNAGAATS